MDEDELLAEDEPDPDGLLDAYVGTCDAGGCDLITSALVWVDEEKRDERGWVSMCYGHAIKEMARPFLPE